MHTAKDINIPKELLWDYKEPPDDLFWRLQRIADFFPAFGVNEITIKSLFENRDKLKLEPGKHRLIELYHEVWFDKAGT